mgnify:CR=1 FL=1
MREFVINQNDAGQRVDLYRRIAAIRTEQYRLH